MSRRFDNDTINLALSILHGQLGRFAVHDIGTPDVRLALRVLRRHIPECSGLAEFWRQGTAEMKHPWESGHGPYREIVRALQDAGWTIERAWSEWPSPRD